jgi:hypothetical protein
MRINELLVESQQLDEGPFGQAVGKAVGGVAKGVGAVAGGIAGIPGAVKKGFKAGKAAVSGDPAVDATQPAPAAADSGPNWDEVTGAPLSAKAKAEYEKFSPEEKAKIQQAVEKEKASAAPARTAPAAGTVAPAASTTAPAKKAGGGFIDQFKKGFAQGRSEPAAPTADPAAPAAATATAPVAEPVAEPAPVANPKADAQSKVGVGQINKIIPTLRTRDLMSLKKNLDAVIATKQKTPADPAAQPADTSTAAAPVDQATPPETTAKKGRKKKAVAPTQAEIDADRERNIGMASDSVIRTGASLSETLARKVQEQKQRMFETALMSGTQSVFKK